jgi:SET and MYND domain-containing protein
MRTTRAVAPGELLLLLPPLAALVGPPDNPPTPQQLVDSVVAAGPEGAAASPWLGLLYDGTRSTSQQPVDLSQADGGAAAAATAGRSGGGGGGAGAKPPQGAKRERQQLRRRVTKAVAFNAFADKHQDLALAALSRAAGLQEERPAALVGLWPEFAMLNHSCAPNAINCPAHLAGGRPLMAVRAARGIAEGAHLCVCACVCVCVFTRAG